MDNSETLKHCSKSAHLHLTNALWKLSPCSAPVLPFIGDQKKPLWPAGGKRFFLISIGKVAMASQSQACRADSPYLNACNKQGAHCHCKFGKTPAARKPCGSLGHSCSARTRVGLGRAPAPPDLAGVVIGRHWKPPAITESLRSTQLFT